MASALTHAFASVALKKVFHSGKSLFVLWYFTIFCSVIPDADVLAFKFGIRYGHMFGHRGFFHSISFALLLGFLITVFFFKYIPRYSLQWWQHVFYFSIVTVSHSALDAMTNGGLGVAFFAPFYNGRYFFPWRPIQVSEFQIKRFFSEEGMTVLKSEFVWVWIPSLVVILLSYVIRRFVESKNSSDVLSKNQ